MKLRAVAFALPLLILAQCGQVNSGCTPTPVPPPRTSIVIGTSVQGRPIEAVKVADGGPVIVVVGQIHGNEDAPLLAADAAVAHAWQGNTVYVIRTLNVDGAAAHVRTNANGVDLNRDAALTQPESRALADFVHSVGATLVVHVHDPSDYTGYYGGTLAANVAQAIARNAGMSYRGLIANHPFLWIGTGGQSVLVELPAISASDCAGCSDNRTQSTPEHVQWMANTMVDTLDGAL